MTCMLIDTMLLSYAYMLYIILANTAFHTNSYLDAPNITLYVNDTCLELVFVSPHSLSSINNIVFLDRPLSIGLVFLTEKKSENFIC